MNASQSTNAERVSLKEGEWLSFRELEEAARDLQRHLDSMGFVNIPLRDALLKLDRYRL